MGICIISRFAFAGLLQGAASCNLVWPCIIPYEMQSAVALSESSPCQHRGRPFCQHGKACFFMDWEGFEP